MQSVAPECEDPMKRACIVGSKSPGFINHKHGRDRPKHLSVPKPTHLAKTSHDSCHPGIHTKRREVTHTGREEGLGDSCQRLRARGHRGERGHGKWRKPLRVSENHSVTVYSINGETLGGKHSQKQRQVRKRVRSGSLFHFFELPVTPGFTQRGVLVSIQCGVVSAILARCCGDGRSRRDLSAVPSNDRISILQTSPPSF